MHGLDAIKARARLSSALGEQGSWASDDLRGLVAVQGLSGFVPADYGAVGCFSNDGVIRRFQDGVQERKGWRGFR